MVARAVQSTWWRRRPASSSPAASGTSPFRTMTSPSKPSRGTMPARTASPLPRRSAWTTRSAPARQDGLDLLAVGARDNDQARRTERRGRVEHVGEQRPSADGVQHLGKIGLHARAETGGQDHHGQRPARARGGNRLIDRHGVHSYRDRMTVASGARLSGRGPGWGGRIRTSDHGTKTRCLATWPRPTGAPNRGLPQASVSSRRARASWSAAGRCGPASS